MSTVAIVVGGNDITNSVIFSSCSFETQFGGVPGTFSMTVRDPNRTLSFQSGTEMYMTIDGVRQFGGYVTQVSMSHMAPAADTSSLSTYNLRTWILRGTDYNIIFDKRVWRNTADYLSSINLTGVNQDGPALIDLVTNYADLSGFTTTGITSTASLNADAVVQQGEKLRTTFQTYSFFGGTIWYIDANKNFIYKPIESAEKRWGFSDQPNHNAITVSPSSYQGATTGFRSVEGQEDGSYIVNDALVWGGGPFAGSSGGTVFSRSQDSTSQSTYGRWQLAETHFGESGYGIQAGVDARSDVIVNGPPGADVYGQQKGLRYPQWQFTFTWTSNDVPLLSGVPDHLVAGDIVTIEMNVFGVTKLLPLRSLRVSFPDAISDPTDQSTRIVQFDGTFGLQIGDPFTLWRYILSSQARINNTNTTPTAVTTTSTSTVYGAYGQFDPSPAPDNSTTLFTLPFGYISGTLQVYQGTTGGAGAALLRPGVDFTESDNVAGEFTMAVAPPATDYLIAIDLTLSS